MNAPQQGTSTASAIAGALVTLICAAWLAAFGKQIDPTVQNAINYLLTVAISFKTHGGAMPSLADIKASVIADLTAAGKVVAAPAAGPATAILFAIGLGSGLVACANNQDPQSILFTAEAGLTTVANLDIAYKQLPACAGTASAKCFDPATQAKIVQGINDAKTSIVAAEKTILGCDLPTYVASHQTPPVGQCGTPVSDLTAQQAAASAAANALAAVQSMIPIAK